MPSPSLATIEGLQRVVLIGGLCFTFGTDSDDPTALFETADEVIRSLEID